MKTVIKIEKIVGEEKSIVTVDTEDKSLAIRILEDAEIINKVINVEVVEVNKNIDKNALEFEEKLKEIFKETKRKSEDGESKDIVDYPWWNNPINNPYINYPYREPYTIPKIGDFYRPFEITC